MRGCLLYKGSVVLPKGSPKIPLLLQEFQDSPIGGHAGYLRTYKRLAGLFYWDEMKRDVQSYIARCDVSQRNKYQALIPASLLQPLPILKHAWEDISMDFITGLPKSHQYDVILVVVDHLSKSAHFIPLSQPFTAKDVAEKFIKEVVRLHGFPKSIISNRDKVFLNLFWKELFRLSGTSLNFSSGYHPQTDGQTEVVNRSLEAYLRCFTSYEPKQWADWLS